VKVPEWSDLVKLGVTKDMAPVNPDWYYIRAASLARRLYIRSPVGVNTTSTEASSTVEFSPTATQRLQIASSARPSNGSTRARMARAASSPSRAARTSTESLPLSDRPPLPLSFGDP
ncbi:hypothetical protein PRIPAC_94574, partial [Pristionchus pacificus]|uniref:Ribosomal protein n=1 Tax=Pristionchus pacificus TaxID=54126 RepID=A0A2A6BIS9_PRIPA